MSVPRACTAAAALSAMLSPLGGGFAFAEAKVVSAHAGFGTLLFASDADGDADVYAVAARGGPVRRLSRNYDPDDIVGLGATVARRWRDGVFILGRDGRWRRIASGSLHPDGIPVLYDEGRRVAFIRGEKLIIALVNHRRVWRMQLRGPPGVAPDGRNVVFTTSDEDSGKPGVVLMNVATGKTRRLGSGSGFQTLWSPDGSLLFVYRDLKNRANECHVVDVRALGWRPRILARGEFSSAEWSPASRWLALRRSARRGEVITLVNARTNRRWDLSVPRWAESLRWSPRGAHLAFKTRAENGERLMLVNARKRIARTVAQSRSISAPVWAPDGRRVAVVRFFADTKGALAIAGMNGRRARDVFRGLAVGAIDWHPGSRRLVFVGNGAIGVIGVNGRMFGRSRMTFSLSESSELVWSPRRTAVAFTAGHGGDSVYVLRGDGRRLARLTRRGHDRILAWLPSRMPRRSRPVRAPPSSERAAARTLDTHGPVVAVSAHGRAAGVLVASHDLDCNHPVVWEPGRRVIRIGTPAPCPDSESVPFDVGLSARSIEWSSYSCGNNCYVNAYRAARAATDAVKYLGEDAYEDPPEPPLPPAETRRGVSILVSGGVVRLRRLADGAERTISAPARIFDAELEDDGLFYAFNRSRGSFRGRIVFVPFDELFSAAS
jgi:Tol biopolymer transport system component